MFSAKPVLNYLSIFVIGFLTIPSVAILATWNTLPGQKLYPIKRNLENIALKIVGGNFKAESQLRSKFVDRRFSENSILLAQSSTEGLDELTGDARSLKDVILSAENNEERQEAAKKLSVQLENYNNKLEQQKQTTSQSYQPPSPTTTTQTVTAPSQPKTQETTIEQPTYQPPPQETAVPPSTPKITPPPEKITQEITQTQQEIEQIIKELEKVNSRPPSPPSAPFIQQQQQEKEDDSHDKGKDTYKPKSKFWNKN